MFQQFGLGEFFTLLGLGGTLLWFLVKLITDRLREDVKRLGEIVASTKVEALGAVSAHKLDCEKSITAACGAVRTESAAATSRVDERRVADIERFNDKLGTLAATVQELKRDQGLRITTLERVIGRAKTYHDEPEA